VPRETADPFSGTLFVFRSRRATSILVYDGQGFWLATTYHLGMNRRQRFSARSISGFRPLRLKRSALRSGLILVLCGSPRRLIPATSRTFSSEEGCAACVSDRPIRVPLWPALPQATRLLSKWTMLDHAERGAGPSAISSLL
jgi:hypothetical protein